MENKTPESTTVKTQFDRQQLDGRRGFLLWTIFSVPSLIVATLSAFFGAYVFGKPKITTTNWADAGDVTGLQDKVPREVSFQHQVADAWEVKTQKSVAWLVIDSEQQVTAFSSLCTHLGCAYGWSTERQAFLCPCHGSAFDVSGNVINGPASRPLDRYPVRVEGTRVWLGPLRNSKNS